MTQSIATLLEDDPHLRSNGNLPFAKALSVSPHSGADGRVQDELPPFFFPWMLTVFTSLACYPGAPLTAAVNGWLLGRDRWGLLSSYNVTTIYPCGQLGSSSFTTNWRFLSRRLDVPRQDANSSFPPACVTPAGPPSPGSHALTIAFHTVSRSRNIPWIQHVRIWWRRICKGIDRNVSRYTMRIHISGSVFLTRLSVSPVSVRKGTNTSSLGTWNSCPLRADSTSLNSLESTIQLLSFCNSCTLDQWRHFDFESIFLPKIHRLVTHEPSSNLPISWKLLTRESRSARSSSVSLREVDLVLVCTVHILR